MVKATCSRWRGTTCLEFDRHRLNPGRGILDRNGTHFREDVHGALMPRDRHGFLGLIEQEVDESRMAFVDLLRELCEGIHNLVDGPFRPSRRPGVGSLVTAR